MTIVDNLIALKTIDFITPKAKGVGAFLPDIYSDVPVDKEERSLKLL